MFEHIESLGPESKLAKELRKISVNMFNRIPESSGDRTTARRYERVQKDIREQISSRSDEIMDALTDMVKDYPTEKEIKRADNLLQEVLKSKVYEDDEKEGDKKMVSLADKIAKLEATVPQHEKNMVYRNELKNLKETLEKVIKELVAINWSDVSEEDSERLYAFSEMVSTSNSIIDSILSEISLNSSADIKQGMTVLLYLVLRTNAYLLGKITHNSLAWTISAVQAYAYANVTYLLAN